MQPDHADRGVGLVHGSIGRDAQIVFGAAFAGPQRGGAIIAGAGVDLVENDHELFPENLVPGALRHEVLLRRTGTVTNAGVWYGPGSAAHCTASGARAEITVPSPRPSPW